jgi:hypothetical protein
MPINVAVTPTYSDLTYSKGPRSVYYYDSNESYLKLDLNVAQDDIDDEWGRTVNIAFRSLIDHVTDIWINLYGNTPSSGAGIAGYTDSLLEMVDTANSRIVFPRVPGTKAEDNTTSTTILKDGQLTFDLSGNIGLFCNKMVLGDGFELRASSLQSKQIVAHSLDNFQLNFVRQTTNSILLRVPYGDDTNYRSYSFGESSITFDTAVTLSAGATTLTSLTTGTATVNLLEVGSDLEVTSSRISYCESSPSVRDWMLTSYRLVLGNNLPTQQRLELNNEKGLAFYCGTGGALEGQISNNLLAQFFSGVQGATVVTDASGATFKLHNGSSLNLQSAQSIFRSDLFRLAPISASVNYTDINPLTASFSFKNTDTSNKLVLSSDDGLAFYCGAGGALSGELRGNYWAQYYGTDLSTIIESSSTGTIFKMHNGAELFLGSASPSVYAGYIRANTFTFSPRSGSYIKFLLEVDSALTPTPVTNQVVKFDVASSIDFAAFQEYLSILGVDLLVIKK